jgi:hypothetical protein
MITILLSVMCTGILLGHTGWFTTSRSPRSDSVQLLNLPATARADDPIASEASLRWLQGQPRHWRACLLNH